MSFWLSAGLTLGVAAAAVLAVFGGLVTAVWGLALGLVIAAVGWSPRLARPPYEAWTRLSKKARRAVRLWLTGVVFMVLTAVGWLGDRLYREPGREASGWGPKAPLVPESYAGDSPLPQKAGAEAGWVRRLGEWSWRSGHVWVWSLIPLLALLKGVEGESRGSLGGNVYTLY
jgi:hypothetical protein